MAGSCDAELRRALGCCLVLTAALLSGGMWKSLSENGSNYPPRHPLLSSAFLKITRYCAGAGAVSLHCAGLGRVISHISCPAISRSALPSARPSCFYTLLLAEADIFYGDLKQVRGGGIEVVEEETTLGTESNPAFFLPLPQPAPRLLSDHVTNARSGCCCARV